MRRFPVCLSDGAFSVADFTAPPLLRDAAARRLIGLAARLPTNYERERLREAVLRELEFAYRDGARDAAVAAQEGGAS